MTAFECARSVVQPQTRSLLTVIGHDQRRSSAGSKPGQEAGQGSADVAEQHRAEHYRGSAAPHGSNQAASQQVPPSASAIVTNLGDSNIAPGSTAASPAADASRQFASGDAEQSPLRRSWGASSPISDRTAVQFGGLDWRYQPGSSPAVPATSPSAPPPQSPSAQVTSGLLRWHARQATSIAVCGTAPK